MNAPAVLAAPPRLTRGQLQILRRVAGGMTSAEIGAELGVTPWTVGDTCTRIRQRIGGRNNAQMVALAVAKGLLDVAEILQAERLAERMGLRPLGPRTRGAQP